MHVHSSDKVIYFKVRKKVCRFSMFKFSLIIGLNCGELCRLDLDVVDDGNQVCDILLDGCTKFRNITL